MFANQRLGNLSRSEIRIMSIECEKVGGINLSQGICDLPIPSILADQAKNAIDKGLNHYTRYDGLPELKEAIGKKLLGYNQIHVNPETELLITSGATGAFYSACLGLLSPGDEVILFEPFYGYHEYTLLALDLVPLYTELKPPAWTFDISHMESLVTKKTKGIMVNTPANPSGKIFSHEELEQLAEFCIRHDLLLFTDEIYEYIHYDGLEHISPGSMESIKDRVITISGYSKTFSITGWRIGYLACQESFTEKIGCACDLVYVCAPAPLQSAVCEAINTLPESFYSSLSKKYEEKRNRICTALKDAGITPYIPQGAYYVLADASGIMGNTGKEKAMHLLDKTGIATVPGESFYHGGKGNNLLRFCFAKDDHVLDEACERLQKIG